MKEEHEKTYFDIWPDAYSICDPLPCWFTSEFGSVMESFSGYEDLLITLLSGHSTDRNIVFLFSSQTISVEWRQANPRNFQEIYTEPSDEEKTYDEFFHYLRECDRNNYILACSIAPKPGSKLKEKKRPDGLVEGICYSVLWPRSSCCRNFLKERLE